LVRIASVLRLDMSSLDNYELIASGPRGITTVLRTLNVVVVVLSSHDTNRAHA